MISKLNVNAPIFTPVNPQPAEDGDGQKAKKKKNKKKKKSSTEEGANENGEKKEVPKGNTSAPQKIYVVKGTASKAASDA